MAEVDVEGLDWGENGATVGRVLEMGQRLESGEELDASIAIVGPFGTGKTLLAVHLIRRSWNYWAPRSRASFYFPRFFKVFDLAELRFKRRYGADEDDEEERRDDARDAIDRCPLVVIDDVGRVSGYRGEEVYLESVVERRYEAGLATILTANKFPDSDTRFADFLSYYKVFALKGKSHRGR